MVLVAIGDTDALQMHLWVQTRLVATNESLGAGRLTSLELDYGAKRRQLKPQYLKKIPGMGGGGYVVLSHEYSAKESKLERV